MKYAPIRLLIALLVVRVVCGAQSSSSRTAQVKPTEDADRLVESARRGDVRAVEAILAAGVDVNAKSKDGETALVAAASLSDNSDELVELLLARGARVDDRSLGLSGIWVDIEFGLRERPSHGGFRCGNGIFSMYDGYAKADRLGATALLAAAAMGRSKIVKMLVDRGADIRARTFQGVTPLMLATSANDVESTRLLLLKGADVNARAKNGQTALMLVSWSEARNSEAPRREAVRLLLHSGADVNLQDESGLSALMGAAEAGNLDIVKLLWSRGADVNARSKTGGTALMLAAQAGNVAVLNFLLGAGADTSAQDDRKRTALTEAASYRRPQALAVLLESSLDRGKKGNRNPQDVLLVADQVGADYARDLLKEAGVALTDNEELILAAADRKTLVVRNLLEKGANANARGTRSRPVLMYAATVDNPSVVRMLIEKGADANARDDIGETALMEASSSGSIWVARALVDSGADVNLKSDDGTTALINAAWRGRVEIVRLLIDRGADVNARTKSGSTALEKAQYCGYNRVEITRMLKEAGAER